jgi:microcystin-dependent protein
MKKLVLIFSTLFALINTVNAQDVPVGGIIMFSGSINNNFDASGKGTGSLVGYSLCNGKNNTPDLRGRFVVGRGDGDITNTRPGDGGEDGVQDLYLNTEGNRPEYFQIGVPSMWGLPYTTGDCFTTLTAQQSGLPAHSHTGTTNTDGAHKHAIKGQNGAGSLSRARTGTGNNDATVTTETDGSHSHSFTTNTAGGQTAQKPFDNRPPYYVLAFIKRTN